MRVLLPKLKGLQLFYFNIIYTIKTQLKYIQSGSLIMNPYRTKNFVHNIETSY